MPVIKVSFFRDMSYDSHTRHVSLPHMVSDRLHMVICQMMQAGEFFLHATTGQKVVWWRLINRV